MPIESNVQPVLPDSDRMSLEQLWWYSHQIANSDFVPRGLKGKPLEIFITIQYGATLNIPPMASLHGIAVINGVPSIYGDLLVSLMVRHKDFEDQRFEFVDIDGDRTCYCYVKRRGRSLFTSKFSMSDARLAKLLDKPVWRLYPDNMLMRRAMNTAIHYVFPDVLYVGLVAVDTPYKSDGLSDDTLISSNQPATDIKDGDIMPDILDTSKLNGDISARPVSESSPLVSDKPSKPNVSSSLPSVEYLNNVIGTGNKGRSDIMAFYTDFINLPDDERLPSYGILLSTLLEYVNCAEVTRKAIDVINKHLGANQCVLTKLSDIRWDSVSNVPINILDKMVTRLTTHWVPERIAGSEAIVHLSKSTGVPETMFFERSEFYADSACAMYVNARKSGLVVNSVIQECKDLVINANPEYDYCSIEYSYLPEIHQNMSHFIDFEMSSFNNDFVDGAFIDNITDICNDNGIDLFVLLNPFCHYPDARLISKSLSDDIMVYLKYLITVKPGDIVYPTDVQCIDIIGEAVKNNTDVFGVAKLCTGNCFVQVSDIPLSMLQDAGYLLD